MIVGASPGYPGAGRVLSELGKVFNGVRYLDLSINAQTVSRPDILILAAWHPEYPKLIEFLRPERTIVCHTSPLLQSEMVPQELEYIGLIKGLLNSGRIHAVWCGDKNATALFGEKAFHAPYPVSLPGEYQSGHTSPPKDISLFGPMHPRKNVLVQALAVSMIQDAVLHITDGSAVPSLRTAGVNFHDHGWLLEPAYHKLLMTMDAGLQVSVPGVESLSYVCVDHLSRGIPVLGTVDWLPEELKVARPFDPKFIADKMKRPLPSAEFCRNWMRQVANGNNRRVKETLEQVLGLRLGTREL